MPLQSLQHPSQETTTDMSSQVFSAQSSPALHRYEVEMYAHTLKAKLELASFKAVNGLGKVDIAVSARATAPQRWQPSRPALNDKVTNSPRPSSPSTDLSSTSQIATPAGSQKSQRSIYADIFGKDFRPHSRSPRSNRTITPEPKIKAETSTSALSPASRHSIPRFGGTSSLLDKAASSPQLGSPERLNGKFDWHNNPSPEMQRREQSLAASGNIFALSTASPSRHKRMPSLSTKALLASPRRKKVQSYGSHQPVTFLPNGHPATPLAQGLGITAPIMPRSCQTSALGRRQVIAARNNLVEEQDQEEQDRVASALVEIAESRNNSSGSDSSRTLSGSTYLTPRKAVGFADPLSITPVRAREHGRNVSWANAQDAARPKTPEGPKQSAQDAAHGLLFLANSPSPANATRFEGSAPLESFHGKRKRDSASPPITPPPSGRSRHCSPPRTPPPFQPNTPQAPGSDFVNAEFCNVSPSPNPRRTPKAGPSTGVDRTPSRSSRAPFQTFDDSDSYTLTPGPSPR